MDEWTHDGDGLSRQQRRNRRKPKERPPVDLEVAASGLTRKRRR